MKKIKHIIGNGLFLLGIGLLSVVLPSNASARTSSIKIQDAPKSMTIGAKTDLDSKIKPYYAKVRDRNIIWSSSDPKTIKVLDKRDDDTKIKALKTGKATITVRIKGTTISASKIIQVKKSIPAFNSDFKEKINVCNSDTDKIYLQIQAVVPASASNERQSQYRELKRMIENVENSLDRLDDQIEDQYDSGKMTRKEYRSLEKLLDAAEDYTDDTEDLLEQKFLYEFD